MLGVQTPNEADPTGDSYAFEKGTTKQRGSKGFADVWKRGHFAWEYKGKCKDLEAAYAQLLQYREALENPPCLVVCDLDRLEVHTNFTGTKTVLHAFTLDDLRTAPSEPLRVLRAVMSEPEALRPNMTREQITEEAAGRFAALAEKLRARGLDAHAVAQFLNRLLFCFFAEDIGVLPRGLLTRLLVATSGDAARFTTQLAALFGLMHDGGGDFGAEKIEWLNGGLFGDAAVLPLEDEDLEHLLQAARLDWFDVEPAVLGTLFERGLDPLKRGQLGAHYTDRQSILRVIEPVVIAPLRAELETMKARVLRLLAAGHKPTARAKGQRNPNRVFRDFLQRLRAVRVLDPACGSGNFLYVALQRLKDLEKEAIRWGAETLKMTQELPGVGPEVVVGIEINAYAAELARVTIWIGEIQWMINNGFAYRTNPVLRPLDSVLTRDAILAFDEQGRQLPWPAAEFIVGNPPFIGGKQLRDKLGDGYVDALLEAWRGVVPAEADLVCYWHERAREMIEARQSRRVGLLATQAIRKGANLKILEKIKRTGDIFVAWSDQPWVVDGADVRVSIVGFDDGAETNRMLDGRGVDVIHADLTGGALDSVDLTSAKQLRECEGLAFMGDTKGGPFDIDPETARGLLTAGPNINGRPNSDVIVPWVNTMDVAQGPRDRFIVDFGVRTPQEAAAQYEAPYEYIRKAVEAIRAGSRTTNKRWWIHERPRPKMRQALAPLSRFLVTPTTAKYRTFVWLRPPTLPDHQLIAFAREDDYFFGVLHSRPHEVWSLGKIGRKGVGNDPVYAHTFAFLTFPFPWPLGTPDAALSAEQRAHRAAIAGAAKKLDEQRRSWLVPPGLVRRQPDVAGTLPPRVVPVDEAAAKQLAQRTITNLYNQRPGWLELAHERLNCAVHAAYGWPKSLSDQEVLARLLELNHSRAEAG